MGIFFMLVSSKVGYGPNSFFTRHWFQGVIPHPVLYNMVPGLDMGFWFLEGYDLDTELVQINFSGGDSIS